MKVSGTREFREPIATVGPFPPSAGKTVEFPVIRYTGTSKKPQWMDEEEGEWNNLVSPTDAFLRSITDQYKTLSHIHIDAANVPCVARMSPLGLPIFIQAFEIIYIYGETEFKAQVAWKENVRRRVSDRPLIL